MHTLILSDIHLTEIEDIDPNRPLWMAYKRREFFVDDDVLNLVTYAEERADGPLELILNGDIFDFDSVRQLPTTPFAPIDWLAKARGLGSEAWMSEFKIETILKDHRPLFAALAAFVERGNRIVFIAGNHDLELLWPSVQTRIRKALRVSNGDENVRFCNWFYISGEDTYVSHGHQYDHFCSAKNAIDPLIEIKGRPQIRLPFGDLCHRYLINGMGYFNPNAAGNYIMGLVDYTKFFFKYMAKTQPLLLITWFWGSIATLLVTLNHHWRPAMRDPLTVDDKVRDIAKAAQASPAMVRQLHALSIPPACSNPFLIFRELWLDRGFLLLFLFFAACQIILVLNYAWPISPLNVLIPIGLMLPLFFLYAYQVRPTVFAEALINERRAELIHQITGATNVICGHTHEPEVRQIREIRYINGGFWSPNFKTPECKERVGAQTFVWIRPNEAGGRSAELLEWPDDGVAPLTFVPGEK